MSSAHGTASRYQQGCRCNECRAGRAAYQRKYRANPAKRAQYRDYHRAYMRERTKAERLALAWLKCNMPVQYWRIRHEAWEATNGTQP